MTVDGFARPVDRHAVRLLVGHTDEITCLAAPDLGIKNYLLSGSADFTVRVWNLEYARYAADVAWSPPGPRLMRGRPA